MAKKNKATPKGQKVTREFTFKLTETEIVEKMRGAKNWSQEVTALSLKFEEMKENMKAKLTAAQSKERDLLAVAYAEEEKRTVDCVMVRNYESKEVEYWFEGEILEKRTMTPNELQVEADFTKQEKKARAIRQKIEQPIKPDPVAAAHAKQSNGMSEEIAEVRRLETGRNTKSSAVDGAVTQ